MKPGARHGVVYALLLLLGVGGFVAIRAVGVGFESGATPAQTAAVVGARGDVLFHLLLALVTIMITARALGAVFRYLRQPAVIGEVIAGVVLGPTLLGRVAPEAAHYLLPAQIGPHLGAFAQLGVILYMFVIGVELDFGALRRDGRTTVLVAHTSIVVPFLLGSALALPLYARLAPAGVGFTVFALFLGVAMAVTAFPVLARILADHGLQRSTLGVIALSCAAVDDVTAWCLLALLVAIAQADLGAAVQTAALTVAFIAGTVVIVRPLLERYLAARDDGGLTRPVLATILVGALGSALATEAIGIHALFGGFLFGLMVPAGSKIARAIAGPLQDLTVVLFLPAYFAFTGLRTEIALVSTATDWLICGAIILVATAGKLGSSTIAARALGMRWRDAAALGALLNTRGLMQLIVLNIGLDLGVLSPTLFAMMVVMALVTTLMTSPLLTALQPPATSPVE